MARAARTVLTAEAIFAAQDLPKTWVECPEWGKGSGVYIRGMTGAERDQFESRVSGLQAGGGVQMDYTNLRASLVASCAVDGDGNRIFKTGDVDALGKKAGVVLDRLFDAARRASGIGDSDMQELAKN